MGNLCLRRPTKERQCATDDLLKKPLQGPLRDMTMKHPGLSCEAGQDDPDGGLASDADPRQIFELGARIGKGSFASVYRAVDRRDGEEVVVKLLTVMNEEHAKGVMLEAQAQLRVQQHDNITRIYGVFCDTALWSGLCSFNEARVWVVQELVLPEGSRTPQSLSDDIAHTKFNRTWTTAKVISFLQQLSSALKHMHERRVVHRDLKPANIIMGGPVTDPVFKIIDFGSALLLPHGCEEVDGEGLVGSWPYIAPECYGLRYSAAVDVFSLGCAGAEVWLGKGAMEIALGDDGETPLLAELAGELVEAADEEHVERMKTAIEHTILPAAKEQLDRKARGSALAERGGRKGQARCLATLLTEMLSYDPSGRPSASATLSALRTMAITHAQ